jgi:LAO/AO transport system kinase
MPDEKAQRPAWVPPEGGEEFAARLIQGVMGGHDGMSASSATQANRPAGRRPQLSVEEYVEGVLARDRATLARAITLVESNAPAHFATAQEVLHQLLPHTGNAIRIGITGVPGAGKSTFIESLGTMLTEQGHQVAVLAVDPTSTRTRGSILGDKTRMENLARDSNAFIRPSPTGGVLGGVARKSRETMLVCEAAGFDVVLVETVGTGQSEVTVRSMVDFFLLLLITGAGDELQGIKKGVIELADALVINKADGENKVHAEAARGEYNRALHYLTPATEGWQTRAYTCSSLTGEGIPEIWEVIASFRQKTTESGVFEARRQQHNREWLHTILAEQLRLYFYNHPAVRENLATIEEAVMQGEMSATAAAQHLLQAVNPAPDED